VYLQETRGEKGVFFKRNVSLYVYVCVERAKCATRPSIVGL